MFRHLSLLLPLLVLFTGMLIPSTAEARVISRNAEISVGRETASQIEEYFRVDTDPVAVARVRQIGQRLAACVENPEYPFEFHVVESGEVNAFALPGGFVYVFRGLLQLVPDDDALAFVLAHEISHVTRRHAIRQFEKNLLLSTGITAILAGAGASRGVWRAGDVVQSLAGLAFTRGDERDADDNGLRLLLDAGYNPAGALEAMSLLQRVGGKDKTPDFLRTHPAPESRLQQLTQEVEAARKKQADRRPTPPPAPPPVTLRPPWPSLAPHRLQETAWFPLRPGALWLYQTQQDNTTARTAIRVVEALRSGNDTAYRVEFELGRGVQGTLLMAPVGDRYFSRPETDAAAPWRLEAIFPGAKSKAPLRIAGMEAVTVPAGTFECVRVERTGADGKPESVSWFARGVGLVKREYAGTGVRLELLQYQLPDAAPAKVTDGAPK